MKRLDVGMIVTELSNLPSLAEHFGIEQEDALMIGG